MTTPLIYVECDIPEGMSLCEWRRAQCAGRSPRRPLWRRLIRR